jgi:hypothetical protein
MVAPSRNPRNPIDFVGWATKDSVATERHPVDRPDPLHTNLVPELDKGAEDPACDRNPHSGRRPDDGLDLNSVALVRRNIAKRPCFDSDAVAGPLGISEQALSRLEAGLRAQRDQLVAKSVQPVLRTSDKEVHPEPDVHSSSKRFSYLRLLVFTVIPTLTATLVAYHLFGAGFPAGPMYERRSETVEPVRIPQRTPAVEADQQANSRLIENPLPSPQVKSEPESTRPITPQPEPTAPITSGPTSQTAASTDMPTQALPASDAVSRVSPHVRKTHPVQRPRPKSSGPG